MEIEIYNYRFMKDKEKDIDARKKELEKAIKRGHAFSGIIKKSTERISAFAEEFQEDLVYILSLTGIGDPSVFFVTMMPYLLNGQYEELSQETGFVLNDGTSEKLKEFRKKIIHYFEQSR